jgi:hypothetical protein
VSSFALLRVLPLLLLAGCAADWRAAGPAERAPRTYFEDFELVAGEPSPPGCPAQLVRVTRERLCIFRLDQRRPVHVHAAPREMIPQGDSDFSGTVLSANPRQQSARIRVYDLSRPL